MVNMYLLRVISLFLIVLAYCRVSLADESPLQVRVAYPKVEYPHNPVFYYQNVLKLALEKTRSTHGAYEISYIDEVVTADRMRHLVSTGEFANLIWASVTPQRKSTMRVIPVNLLRDFNNYRLLLVLRANKDKFKDVKTLADLKQFNAGNGLNWTDTKILNANGIRVTTSVQYDYLLKMLEANRFDYISRGVHEIDGDLKMFNEIDLAVAEGIVLKYKYPVMYSFFVTKTATLLAERLAAGLLLAEQDGSFQHAYESIPTYKAGIAELNKNRRIIELDDSLIVDP